MRAPSWALGLFLGMASVQTVWAGSVLDYTAIRREEIHGSACAVTFDDGPGERTGELLDILSQRGIKATFFVLGKHVVRYPGIIRRMLAEGHEVETHSWDHPDMRKLDAMERDRQIGDTVRALKELGASPRYFRPPYGGYDEETVAAARRYGLEVVLWSRDSEDWKYRTAASLSGHVMPAHRGANGIFLFHDVKDSTINAMPAVLDVLKGKGCRFLTVGQWASEAQERATQATANLSSPWVQAWLRYVIGLDQ